MICFAVTRDARAALNPVCLLKAASGSAQPREVAEQIRVLRYFNAIRVAKVGASLLVL